MQNAKAVNYPATTNHCDMKIPKVNTPANDLPLKNLIRLLPTIVRIMPCFFKKTLSFNVLTAFKFYKHCQYIAQYY